MKQINDITWVADDDKCFIEIETQKLCGLIIQLGKIYQTNIDDTIDRYTEIDLTDELKNELGIIEYINPEQYESNDIQN
jgi:hypothetical protein